MADIWVKSIKKDETGFLPVHLHNPWTNITIDIDKRMAENGVPIPVKDDPWVKSYIGDVLEQVPLKEAKPVYEKFMSQVDREFKEIEKEKKLQTEIEKQAIEEAKLAFRKKMNGLSDNRKSSKGSSQKSY